MSRRTIVQSVAAAVVAVSVPVAAQQTVPTRNGTPVAPSGIPAIALPDKPVEYDVNKAMPATPPVSSPAACSSTMPMTTNSTPTMMP